MVFHRVSKTYQFNYVSELILIPRLIFYVEVQTWFSSGNFVGGVSLAGVSGVWRPTEQCGSRWTAGAGNESGSTQDRTMTQAVDVVVVLPIELKSRNWHFWWTKRWLLSGTNMLFASFLAHSCNCIWNKLHNLAQRPWCTAWLVSQLFSNLPLKCNLWKINWVYLGLFVAAAAVSSAGTGWLKPTSKQTKTNQNKLSKIFSSNGPRLCKNIRTGWAFWWRQWPLVGPGSPKDQCGGRAPARAWSVWSGLYRSNWLIN